MSGIHEIPEEMEKVILVGVETGYNDIDGEESLLELEELADTAGAKTVGQLLQKREAIHPGTYLGKGKIEELKWFLQDKEATGIITDDELSPAQLKNLEEVLETKVIDRTMLILDIFAGRAQTKEGNIQVELAQLQYRMTRLVGIGKSLSRLGGGIGTRGPGEKKLEVDRRHIRNRISLLKEELKQIETHRTLIRNKRKKNKIPQIALVGYTNAGKSTIFNYFTQAGVLSEDKLFATLDPVTRQISLPNHANVLLTDTVGFIRKLPHHLVQAFHSTLEEAIYADIILHVVDSSNAQNETHMRVVYETLKKLGVENAVYITVFNKIDKIENEKILQDPKADRVMYTSAVTGKGMDDLLSTIEEVIQEGMRSIQVCIPYSQGNLIQMIREKGQIMKESYEEEGTKIDAYVEDEIYQRLIHQLSMK